MQSNLNDLIKRAKNNDRLRCYAKNNDRLRCYSNLFISDVDFSRVKEMLGIVLPNDFLEIGRLFRYDVFSFQELFDFCLNADDWNGVIRNNLEIRKQYKEDSSGQSDMSHILVLADDDGGSVFMITQDSPEKPTPVIWCDYGDMY